MPLTALVSFCQIGGIATETKARKDNPAVSRLKKQLLKPIHGGKKEKKKKSCGSICQHLHITSQELRNQPGDGWVDQPNINKPSWLCLVPFSIVSKDRTTIYHKEALGH